MLRSTPRDLFLARNSAITRRASYAVSALAAILVAAGALALSACGDDEPAESPADAIGDAPEDASVDVPGDDAPDGPADTSGEGQACQALASASVAAEMADLIDGPLATGRPGDVVMRNDRIQVVIQGPGRYIGLNPYGGNIIDADLVRDGPAMDVFGELGIIANLAGTSDATQLTVTADGADCGDAVVVAKGDYALSDYINTTTGLTVVLPGGLGDINLDQPWPLSFEVEYRLRPGEPFVRITTRVTNVGDDAVPAMVAYLAHGGIVDTFASQPEGFQLARVGSASALYFVGAEQAYGLVPLTESRVDRFFIALAGGHALTHDVELLDLVNFPFNLPQLEPGAVLEAESRFVIGADLDAVRRVALELGGEPTCHPVGGWVVESGSASPIAGAWITAARVRSSGRLGDDLSRVVSGADGRFDFCLEPGAVGLLAGQEGRPYGGDGPEPEVIEVTVPDDPDAAPIGVTLELPPTGRLVVTVRDAEGTSLPARLVVIGIDPSPPSYRLAGDGFDPLAPGVSRTLDAIDGGFDLLIEPGQYDVVVTRGPEYSWHREAIEVEPGAPVEVEATLHRVVDTTGFLSGDFHVHAQAGPDSTVHNRARVANMVAEGVEILVSTDHAFVTDYWPVIEALGVEEWVTTVPGQEVTTFDYGHFNLFPLAFNPEKPNNGALDWVGLSPAMIAAHVLDRPEPGVIQLNHPRAIPAPGNNAHFFRAVDLMFDDSGPHQGPDAVDPETARLEAGTELFTTRFIAMEVMTWLNVQGLSDWFNFLNAGIAFTATANSDTHTTRVESSGWPRNWVLLDEDDPAALQQADLVSALMTGKNTVGFGPFVTLTAEGLDDSGSPVVGRIGDEIRPDEGGEVRLTARVQAPTWLPFDHLVIYEGSTGTEVAGGSVVPDVVSSGDAAAAERLEATLVFSDTPESDSWYVALVTGSQGLFPGIPYNEADPDALTLEAIRAGDLEGQATTFALTNPIFVDVDGDGEITPSLLFLPEDWADYRREDRIAPYQ